MKKSFKKSISLLLALLMLMTSFAVSPVVSQAAPTAPNLEKCNIKVWVDAENRLSQANIEAFNNGTSRTTIVGATQPFQIDGTTSSSSGSGLGGLFPGIGGGSSGSGTVTGKGDYYLFLPSNANCTKLKIWIADGDTLTIDGTPVQSGVPTNALEDANAGGVLTTHTFNLNGTNYTVKVLKSGKVGTVYIDTKTDSFKDIYSSKSNHDEGTIMVVQPDGTVDYSGVLAKINGRGNGTFGSSNVKNPYSIKLAKSTSLLGMGKAKKWALLASYGGGSDKTLLANQMTYDLSKYIGINYQVICRPVDVYINQQYVGSYQLSEKVEIKSTRVALQSDAYENFEFANGSTDSTGAFVPADFGTIAPSVTKSSANGKTVGGKKYINGYNDPADITGGYIYQLEISNRWADDETNGFCGYNRQCWIIASGDYASKNMIDYSYDIFYALGGAVYNNGIVPSTSKTTSVSTTYGGNTTNPAPNKYQGLKWSDLLDADSAVKYYWTQEFFKNMDGSTSSTYFYKESDSLKADGDVISKLYAGPVWDMDNSTGNASESSRWGASLSSTDEWYAKNTRIYRYNPSNSNKTNTSVPLAFYGALATNCSDFWKMAGNYWFSIMSPAIDVLLGTKSDPTGTLMSLSDYVENIKLSGLMDYTRYGTASTYNASNIESTYRNWISKRQTWINGQFTKNNISSANATPIDTQYYTGEEITPEFSVTYNDSLLGTLNLTEGVDYEVVYSNNVNTGLAKATIKGINGYTGTKDINFNIVSNKLNNATLTIDSFAYTGTELSATLIDAKGNNITSLPSYQWYKNGSAIAGATSSSYTVTDDDAPSTIWVVASDASNINLSSSCTSNNCSVLEGTRPTGYDQTLAAWDYDYTLDSEALVNADTTGSTYYYAATSGLKQSSATLYASVDAETIAPIEWSGKSDLYQNSSTSKSEDRAPVIETSKNKGIAWGAFPYFETTVSTAGYENIKFSAKLGGTNKAPKYWCLQYSLDGENFTDIDDTYNEITQNKTMEQVFANVVLPEECNNQLKVYIRMEVWDDYAIDPNYPIIMQQSGSAAINNIKITGASLSTVTNLYAPTISEVDNNVAFSNTKLELIDNNGGADVYYTINGGEPVLYTGKFKPFTADAKAGDTAVINAYANFDTITSEIATVTLTYAGKNVNTFVYDKYSKDVVAGAVASTGGTYDESGRMTAYADGKSQYVPLWNQDNGAFSVSPDDGLKWTAQSGFTFKVSTDGYENVSFSCKAYTTGSGPKSVTLQYSTDGRDFKNVNGYTNVPLTANKTLEQAFLMVDLPSECDNQPEVYIRLATTENKTFDGGVLHNNASKGNLYVNNAIISGDDMGTLKMPFTNKSTSYFGANSGLVEFISPDNAEMNYVVYDASNPAAPVQVMAGVYTAPGIKLTDVNGFDKLEQKPYSIVIWAVDNDDDDNVIRSTANGGEFYYKGETVVKFNYNSKVDGNSFEDYVSIDGLTATNTGGVNEGTLEMYPNGNSKGIMAYTDKYGVKVANSLENRFTASKNLDNPANNGYWLIKTSTKGFTNLTLNAEQISSNNGPRDWGIAYSVDNGATYTYLANSNVRAISNDFATKPVETYGNIALPSACDNKDSLYIKIFINGGEGVTGDELELITNGNTGLNGFEINGISTPTYVTVNTTLLEEVGAVSGGNVNIADVDVYVNGVVKATTDSNGLATIGLANGEKAVITFRGNGIAERKVTLNVAENMPVQNIGLMAYDVNNDGYVNAKDFAIINKNSSYSAYKPFFSNFINVDVDSYQY